MIVSRLWKGGAVAGALVVAGGIAAAQTPGIYPELRYSFAATQDAMLKGQVPVNPHRRSPEEERDVFEVNKVDVTPGEHYEELPVGEYDQPLWTTFRRFPSTRVYLQTPPGGVQFEQWFEFRKKKDHDGEDETRVRQELEFGLGHRMQLDMYLREEHVRDGVNSTYDLVGYSAELRYALADWDEIWGNPTIYFEWIFNDGDADKIEPKLLFGGEVCPGWHWGANLIHERTLTASQEQRTEEYAATASISRIIIDSIFSVGATTTFSYEVEPGQPRERTEEWMLGPSFQFIPHERAAINIEPLWGLTAESKRMKIFVVFSWHF